MLSTCNTKKDEHKHVSNAVVVTTHTDTHVYIFKVMLYSTHFIHVSFCFIFSAKIQEYVCGHVKMQSFSCFTVVHEKFAVNSDRQLLPTKADKTSTHEKHIYSH